MSVAFEDEAVADFFDQQVDRGLRPAQFARIWVHTHPGGWPEPSLTDEETFQKVFGRTDWAVDVHPRPGRPELRPAAVSRGAWRRYRDSRPGGLRPRRSRPATTRRGRPSTRPACSEPILPVARHFAEGADAAELDLTLRSAVEGLWLEDWHDPFGEPCGVEGLDHDDWP